MTFKERLRNEIEFKGLRVKDVSEAAGVSNNTFLSYIDARGSLPNVETAVRIAKVLNVSVEYLVTGEDACVSSRYSGLEDVLRDLLQLDMATLGVVKTMVHSLILRRIK